MFETTMQGNEFSPSSLIALFVSGGTICVWFWNVFLWLHKKHKEAKELENEAKRIAQLLLSHATNAAKRSDIYFYMTLRAIELSERQTRSIISSFAVSSVIVFIMFLWVVLSRYIEIDYTKPMIISSILLFIALVVTFFLFIWSSFNLNRIENGWQSGVINAMLQKIEKHAPEVSEVY